MNISPNSNWALGQVGKSLSLFSPFFLPKLIWCFIKSSVGYTVQAGGLQEASKYYKSFLHHVSGLDHMVSLTLHDTQARNCLSLGRLVLFRDKWSGRYKREKELFTEHLVCFRHFMP